MIDVKISNYSHLDDNEYNIIYNFIHNLLNNDNSSIDYLVNNFNILYNDEYILYDKYKSLIIDNKLNIIDYIYWIIIDEYNNLVNILNKSIDEMKYINICISIIELNNLLFNCGPSNGLFFINDKEFCLKTLINKKLDILKVLIINNHFKIINELLNNNLISRYIIFKYFIKYNNLDNLHLLKQNNIYIFYKNSIELDYILFEYYYCNNIDKIYNNIYQIYNLNFIQKILNSSNNNIYNILKNDIIYMLNYNINKDHIKFNKNYNYKNYITSSNYYYNLTIFNKKKYYIDEEENIDCSICKNNLCDSCFNCINNQCNYCNYLYKLYNSECDNESFHIDINFEDKIIIYILNHLSILLEYLLENKLIDDRYILSKLFIPNIINITLLNKYNKLIIDGDNNFQYVMITNNKYLINYYSDNNLLNMSNIIQLYLDDNKYDIQILNDILSKDNIFNKLIKNDNITKLLLFLYTLDTSRQNIDIKIFNKIIILSEFNKISNYIQNLLESNKLYIIEYILDLIKNNKKYFNGIVDLSFNFNADIFLYIINKYNININKDHIINLIDKKLNSHTNINDNIFFQGFKQQRYKFIFNYAHKINLLNENIINKIILHNYNSEIFIYLLQHKLIVINDDNILKIFNYINNIISNNKHCILINFIKKYKYLIDDDIYNNLKNIKLVIKEYDILKNKFIEDHKIILKDITLDDDCFNNIIFDYIKSL